MGKAAIADFKAQQHDLPLCISNVKEECYENRYLLE